MDLMYVTWQVCGQGPATAMTGPPPASARSFLILILLLRLFLLLLIVLGFFTFGGSEQQPLIGIVLQPFAAAPEQHTLEVLVLLNQLHHQGLQLLHV